MDALKWYRCEDVHGQVDLLRCYDCVMSELLVAEIFAEKRKELRNLRCAGLEEEHINDVHAVALGGYSIVLIFLGLFSPLPK